MDFRHILDSRKLYLRVILGVLFTLTTCKTFAIQAENGSLEPKNAEHEQVEHAGGEHEAFNPTTAILEHIADSHYWHIVGETSVPLPIIIFTDKGTEFFSAAKFHHGTEAYQAKYYTYKLIEDKIRVVNAAGEVDKEASSHIYDFSITKNVLAMWIAGTILFIIFF